MAAILFLCVCCVCVCVCMCVFFFTVWMEEIADVSWPSVVLVGYGLLRPHLPHRQEDIALPQPPTVVQSGRVQSQPLLRAILVLISRVGISKYRLVHRTLLLLAA